jgi:hypothetical protein
MDIDFKVEVDHHWVYERPYKVTLMRGAKGDYRWEIEVRGADDAEVIARVVDIDEGLRDRYGGFEPPDEEG